MTTPKNRVSELIATEEAIAAYRRHFACRRCGACCTQFDGVRVTKAEMKKLDIPAEEWDERFHIVGNTYYMKQPCPFYSAGKSGCTIYNARPETCRRFPMHTIKGADGLLHLGVSEICPAAVEALGEVEAERAPKYRISALVATQDAVDRFRELFTCRRCGECCTAYEGVKVTREEIARLPAPENGQLDTFELSDGNCFMKEPCRYYDRAVKGCSIYGQRPDTCRNFPMHNEMGPDGKVRLGAAEMCGAAIKALEQMIVDGQERASPPDACK